MHEEREEKRLRVYTKRKKLGLGRKLEGRKVFGEKVRFGSRYLILHKTGLDLRYIYENAA